MFPSSFMASWPMIVLAVTAIIHIAFSAAIYHDASQQVQYEPTGSFFVRPYIWTLAVLTGGVLIAALYWLMHHSNLRRL